MSNHISTATVLILKEYERAVSLNKPFNSAHEGWAVLKEEVDELWDEVKKNSKNRDPEKMLKEAVQVAAMGMRFIIDVCLSEVKNCDERRIELEVAHQIG